jgi:predicted DNA-binding protein (UPF0251 family)
MTICFDDTLFATRTHATRRESGPMMREFLKAFGLLTNGQREALRLADVEGYSYSRIAQESGVSVITAMSRIERARTTLETLLAGKGTSQSDDKQIALHRAHALVAAGARGRPRTESLGRVPNGGGPAIRA